MPYSGLVSAMARWERLGAEVVVRWGDHGEPIKDIRATVARFPYLAEGRNSDLNAAALTARWSGVQRGRRGE